MSGSGELPVVLLDAIVLADDALANVRIAGLSARERAVRVAKRVGAQRVLVVDDALSRESIASWLEGNRNRALLVVRANQLVHTPLCSRLVKALSAGEMPERGVLRAVGTDGSDGGAYIASASRRLDAAAAIGAGNDTTSFAEDAVSVEHGEIARHPISTPEERKAAHKLLYRILIKPQDNAITRYLYRPISFPLTRMLVWTPITPNMVSAIVACMVAVGCWFVMHASGRSAAIGTIIIFVSAYFDCCDGEIARVKLLSSKLGAWIDTIVDEVSSTAYIVALGVHCHMQFGATYWGFDSWIPLAGFAAVCCFFSMYCIYYELIVVLGTANSQDYVGRFIAVPGAAPNTVRLKPYEPGAKKPLPPALQWVATYAPYLARRDFLSWLTLILAVTHLTQVSFMLQAVGSIVMTVVLALAHFRLLALCRSIDRAGQVIEPPIPAA
ncbi:MAG TPA: CDP-alcohol phosphatidyltransferase family protein [Kofleriaceae bacterium]